jgi:lipoprotein-anchoring transpeptidase ErfK/SrfK
MDRRAFFLGLGALLFAGAAEARHRPPPGLWGGVWDDFDEEDAYFPRPRRRRRLRRKRRADAERKRRKAARRSAARRRAYEGREEVSFRTRERVGTIIIRTGERALYYVLGGGRALRYGVAVGKQGFQWSGVARIGRKEEWPSWTPPEEMIERKPELAEWAEGMPGGIPENPLGARALYLYAGKRDTMFRIHGTNAPSSIGTAASSGCIRMLNEEVIELYGRTRLGTKVIVL